MINDAYDFGIGHRLANLAALVEVGRAINGRLIAFERDAQHCIPAAATFEALVRPSGPRARPPLRRPAGGGPVRRLADFRWAAGDIRSASLRTLVEHHLGAPYGPRQMAYDLRRLVRKGLIERLPHTFRYRFTALGSRLVLFCAKRYSRLLILGHGLSRLDPGQVSSAPQRAWQFEAECDRLIADAHLEPRPKLGSIGRISRP